MILWEVDLVFHGCCLSHLLLTPQSLGEFFLEFLEAIFGVSASFFFYFLTLLIKVVHENLVVHRVFQTQADIQMLQRVFLFAELERIALEEVLLHSFQHVLRVATRLELHFDLAVRITTK